LLRTLVPLPRQGWKSPELTNGVKEDGKMDTSGMSSTKGNVKRDQDGAPAKGDVKK
jgi:hypothetical protein